MEPEEIAPDVSQEIILDDVPVEEIAPEEGIIGDEAQADTPDVILIDDVPGEIPPADLVTISIAHPVYLADGRIDCVVDIGKGQMPYTASPDDSSALCRFIFSTAQKMAPTAYVAPAPDPVADLAAERAGMKVSRYQALATLYSAGLLDAVNAHMAKQDYLTQLAWAETTAFTRTNALIASVAAALNITDMQLDDLFRTGMQLSL